MVNNLQPFLGCTQPHSLPSLSRDSLHSSAFDSIGDRLSSACAMFLTSKSHLSQSVGKSKALGKLTAEKTLGIILRWNQAVREVSISGVIGKGKGSMWDCERFEYWAQILSPNEVRQGDSWIRILVNTQSWLLVRNNTNSVHLAYSENITESQLLGFGTNGKRDFGWRFLGQDWYWSAWCSNPLPTQQLVDTELQANACQVAKIQRGK